jgi:tetratricopeptide (TPR) repeat protein
MSGLQTKTSSSRKPNQRPETEVFSLYNSGHYALVIEKAESLLLEHPNNVNLLNLLGAASMKLNKLSMAIKAFKKITQLKPQNPAGFNNCGNALFEDQQYDEAVKYFERAIKISDIYAPGYDGLGQAYNKLGKNSHAVKAATRAVSLQPDNPTFICNLAAIKKENGQICEAISTYETALQRAPDDHRVLNDMACTLHEAGHLDKALELQRKAVAKAPSSAPLQFNLANILNDKADTDSALKAYHTTLTLNPDAYQVYLNMSAAYLKQQNFSEGFKHYEWRWWLPDSGKMALESSISAWSGQKGKKILVWGEQGVGDTILFSSMMPQLIDASDEVIFRCDQRLIPLFSRSFKGNVRFVAKNDTVYESDCDFQIPIGSLAKFFRQSINDFSKSKNRFLSADEERSLKIRKALVKDEKKKVFGIAWRGGASKEGEHKNKNLPLLDILKMFEKSEVIFLNLQYGNVDEDIDEAATLGINMVNFEEIDNFADIDGVAAQINACDAIITADGINAHLAGALGKNAYILLPYTSDWRWGTVSDRSYWHASLKLIRQTKPGCWEAPFAELEKALSENHLFTRRQD